MNLAISIRLFILIFAPTYLLAQNWRHMLKPLPNDGKTMTMLDSMVLIEPFGILFDLNGEKKAGLFHEYMITPKDTIRDYVLYGRRNGTPFKSSAPFANANFFYDSQEYIYVIKNNVLWIYDGNNWTNRSLTSLSLDPLSNPLPAEFYNYKTNDFFVDKNDVLWALTTAPLSSKPSLFYIQLKTMEIGFTDSHSYLPTIDDFNNIIFNEGNSLHVYPSLDFSTQPYIIYFSNIQTPIEIKDRFGFLTPDSTIRYYCTKVGTTDYCYKYQNQNWELLEDTLKLEYLLKKGYVDKNNDVWNYNNYILTKNNFLETKHFEVNDPNDDLDHCVTKTLKSYISNPNVYDSDQNHMYLDERGNVRYNLLLIDNKSVQVQNFTQAFSLGLETCTSDSLGYLKRECVKDLKGNLWTLKGKRPRNSNQNYTTDQMGLMRLENNNFKSAYTYSNTSSPLARLFLMDQNGVFWMSFFNNWQRYPTDLKGEFGYTQTQLMSFDGSNWQEHPIAGDSVTDCFLDKKNDLWVVSKTHLSRKNAQGWFRYEIPNDIKSKGYLKSIQDQNHIIWFYKKSNIPNDTLIKFEGISWKVLKTPYPIIDLIKDTVHKGFWIYSSKSISFSRDGVNWLSFTKANGLVEDKIQQVIVNKNGEIWIESLNFISSLSFDEDQLNTIVDIEDQTIQPPGFSIYPNPCKENVTIKAPDEDIYSIDILSTDGKHIKHHEQVETIPTGDLNKGLYLLQIKTPSSIKTFHFEKE